MKLILKEYIETLKEEVELEDLLANILFINNFKNIIRPQKGVRQAGVDFRAEKNNTIYLFVLKQKDFDRKNWDIGTNSIRSTLNEIIDSYIPYKLEKKHKIKIIVCCNGIIKQSVENDWNGYIKRNEKDNLKYEFWGIDELAKETEKALLNEYLFNDELKSKLRKTLYFFEEDNGLLYYKSLLKELIEHIKNNLNKNNKYKKALIIYILIVKMCIKYSTEKNNKIAICMAENAVVQYWSYILENNKLRKSMETEILIEILLEYERCCSNYIEDIKKVYKYKPSFPIYNPLEYKILIQEVIGIISTYTYYLIYYKDMQYTEKISENINILITIINNNRGFFYPVYDLNSIDINILLTVIFMKNKSQVFPIVDSLINSIIFMMRTSKYYPVEYENFDKALDMEFGNEVEEIKATLLITNLIEWLIILDEKEIAKKYLEMLNDIYPNITLNTVQIDTKNENLYFQNSMQESLVTFIIKQGESIDNTERQINTINKSYKLEKYKFYQYNALPILFINARCNRLALPSNIFFELKNIEKKKEEK